MTKGTHILGGVLASYALNLPVVPAIVGSVVPDIDMVFGLPKRNKRTLFNAHRGITHHILLVFILPLVMFLVRKVYADTVFRLVCSFVAGYVSHIFLDVLNPLGVPVSFRYYPRASLNVVRSGGLGEWILFALLLGVLLFLFSGRLPEDFYFLETLLKSMQTRLEVGYEVFYRYCGC